MAKEDIIKQLWAGFINLEGAALRAEILDKYGIKVTKGNAIMKYKGDHGSIYLDGKQIGELWVDYSEPCLKYKLDV